MNRAFLLAIVLGVASGASPASPFLPTHDDQVIERLPYRTGNPMIAELRAERDQLTQQPQNLRLALRLATRYIELGRINGDPRYAGYAQAALMPWWRLQRPPREVLLMRATLRQRVHDFQGALADLGALLEIDPRDAQARLTRATVLQVQGHYEAAQEDCLQLQELAPELVATMCLESLRSVTGHLRESYEQLQLALERHPEADPALRSWILTGLAEMAVRAGIAKKADELFRRALEAEPTDFYLLGAYADFLLDQNRPGEAARWVKQGTQADPLLLRYGLALQAQKSAELPSVKNQLRERFAASRARGDRVHLREEARFTLHVLNERQQALQLAKENWAVQREPADIRILMEAALAAGDEQTLIVASNWLFRSKLEDAYLEQLRHSAISTPTQLHPDPARLRTAGEPSP